MLRYKKNIILVSIVIIIIVSGFFIWFSFFRPGLSTPPLVTTPPANETTSGPEVPASKIKIISNRPVSAHWETGQDVFYLTPEGILYKNNNPIEVKITAGSRLVSFSPKNKKAIIAAGSPPEISFSAFDLSDNSLKFLPAEAASVDWNPEANKIAYLTDSADKSHLIILNPRETESSQEITSFTGEDLLLNWSLPDIIYFRDKPSFQALGSLWAYNLKTDTINKIISEKPGLVVKWLDGEKGLMLADNILSIIDRNGRVISSFLDKTIPSKCAYSETDQKLYCAVPKQIPDILELPDDYLQTITGDDIYVFYLNRLKNNFLNQGVLFFTSPSQNISVSQPRISGGRLYFVNRFDDNLYALDL